MRTFLCFINGSETEASIDDVEAYIGEIEAATIVDVEANIYDFKASA